MKYFYDVTFEEWNEWVKKNDFPLYKAEQIYRWKAKGIQTYDDMRNISIAMRKRLSEDFYIDGMVTLSHIQSALDETVKYVFRLKDGNTIESVLMKYRHGLSVCVSSQAGCRMGCDFCASSRAGFGRSLTVGEMLAQVAVISRDAGKRISTVVVMGIGEPFDNYEHLVHFIREINHPDSLGIGMRHISVSTCGLVDDMLKFTQEGLPVTLSVSLHAPNDEIRMKLMPIAKRYPLAQLLAACRVYGRQTGRRVTFEYALMRDVNDQPAHARELAALLKGIPCHVNLIPANEWESGPYQKSKPDTIDNFRKILADHHVQVTIRRELGADIQAACGQLRRKSIQMGQGE